MHKDTVLKIVDTFKSFAGKTGKMFRTHIVHRLEMAG